MTQAKVSKSGFGTAARAIRAISRQQEPAFGKAYVPAIKATREEAPGRSEFSLYPSQKFDRSIHCLSRSELAVAVMLDYHPAVFEVWEQHLIPNLPMPHPMSFHPLGSGIHYPHLKGLINVAEERHAERYLPRTLWDSRAEIEILNNWIGDFMVFVADDQGPPYCVNLSIKLKHEDFGRRALSIGMTKREITKLERLQMRHRLEVDVYASGRIPTRQIAAEVELDRTLVANLKRLGWAAADVTSPTEQDIERIQHAFAIGVANRETPNDVAGRLRSQFNYPCRWTLDTFYSLVWNRSICIDLYRPVDPDYRLFPEVESPLDRMSNWIKRD